MFHVSGCLGQGFMVSRGLMGLYPRLMDENL